MAKLIPHVVAIDGKKYVMMAPDIYDNIKTDVGIEKAPSPDNNVYAGKIRVNSAVAEGDLVRITCRLENKKTKTVLCVASKFSSAMGALLAKKVGGTDVRSTRIPRRMKLG